MAEFREMLRIAQRLWIRQDQPPSRSEYSKNVPDRQVEREGRNPKYTVVPANGKCIVHAVKSVRHSTMVECHTLWRACGTGGVDDIG